MSLLTFFPLYTKELYPLPLKEHNGYSSSFMEYRSTHFHAGIDLRTFQKTGYPVYSIANGYLYKIRSVRRGSGNGVYILHDDGNYSIYFHLEKFAPKIEKIYLEQIKSRGKYFGNYFPKTKIRIKKGELIASSGETGAGYPHLHLEIRDKDYAAINPFKVLDYEKEDFTPSHFKFLIVKPYKGIVNGEIKNYAIEFLKKENNYVLKEPVIYTNSLDLVLSVKDIADTFKTVAPYKIVVKDKEEEIYKLEFNRFFRKDNNLLGYVYNLFYSPASYYTYNLFYQPGFYIEKINKLNPKFFEQKVGNFRLIIEVEDNFENKSFAILDFNKVEEPKLIVKSIKRENNNLIISIEKLFAKDFENIELSLLNKNHEELYTGQLRYNVINSLKNFVLNDVEDSIKQIEFRFLKNNKIIFRKNFKTDKLINKSKFNSDFYINRNFFVIKTNGNYFKKMTLRINKTTELELIPKILNKSSVYYSNDLNKELKDYNTIEIIDKDYNVLNKFYVLKLNKSTINSFSYKDFTLSISKNSVNEEKLILIDEKDYFSKYPILTEQISLYPYDIPFTSEVYIQFKKRIKKPYQCGIFEYDIFRNRWKYRYTTYDKINKTFECKTRKTGIYALLRDILPPKIKILRTNTKYFKYMKNIDIFLTDEGKGIDFYSINVLINGKKIEEEYDPDWNRIRITNIYKYLKKGKNIIKISVKDHAKNKSSKKYSLKLK